MTRPFHPALLLAAFLISMTDTHQGLAGGTIRISIPSQSTVDEEWIYLGRIARVEGDDRERVERIQKVALANAPGQGQTRWLEPETVRLRLKQSGIEAGDLRLQAPDRFAVIRGAAVIDPDRIREVVLDHLREHRPAGQEPPRVEKIETEEGIIVPPGKSSIRVVPGSPQWRAGRVRMALEVSVDGRPPRRTWATAELDQQVEMVVAARPLQRGRVIEPEDLEVRMVNLDAVPAGALSHGEQAVGLRTRRPVNAGATVDADLLDRPAIVQRGDAVLMLIEAGGMRVTALGVAKKPGRLGERIMVENLESRKQVYASVLDARTVRVDF
jgi:flagella basal body P-ring formation protein FlgA